MLALAGGISCLAVLFIGNEDGKMASMAIFGLIISIFEFFIAKQFSKNE
jgi:hypothetical protein